MQEMLKIKGSNCSRFTNALHVAFHSRINERLNLVADLTKIHVSEELKNEYESYVAELIDRSKPTLATGKTQDLADADAKRDNIVPCIWHTAEAGTWSPIESVKNAARVLLPVVNPYKGIQTAADDAETALIDGLLKDLRKDEYTVHVQALHLSEVLEALEEANNAYRQLKEERTNQRLLNAKGETTKVVRQQTDQVYQRICELIYASELICAVPDDQTLIRGIINEFNAIIDEFNASANMSKGQKGEDKEEESEGDDPQYKPITPQN